MRVLVRITRPARKNQISIHVQAATAFVNWNKVVNIEIVTHNFLAAVGALSIKFGK